MRKETARQWGYGNFAGARLGRYCRASDDARQTEKSVTDQDEIGRAWGEGNGCVPVEPTYVDNDASASWYATRPREDFERLCADITQDRMDLLWMWHLSRTNRSLAVYARLRDLCIRHGVNWIINGRYFDLTDPLDLQALGYDAVNNEVYSVKLSADVRRGKEQSAARGRPPGRVNYGYRRVYDGRGRYVEQLPDDAPRSSETANGQSYEYSPADVVREIIRGIGDGVDVITLERRFNHRGIPGPGGGAWSRTVVRRIARNPVYLGQLVRHGEVMELDAPPWPALVTEEEFYAAQNVLDDPRRKKTKPSKATHLLSYIGRCWHCEEHLRAYTQKTRPDGTKIPGYMCSGQSCATILMGELDDFVTRVVVGYLSRERVHEHLMRADGDTEIAKKRGEAERLRHEIETWRQLGEQGADAVTVLRSVESLTARAKALDEEIQARALPPVLRGRTGAALPDLWEGLDLTVKREIIRACADVRIKSVGKGRRNVPLDENRVTWRWLVGPDAT